MRLIFGIFLRYSRTFRNLTNIDEDCAMALSETTRRSNRAVLPRGESGTRSYLISNDRPFTKFTVYFPTITMDSMSSCGDKSYFETMGLTLFDGIKDTQLCDVVLVNTSLHVF